MAEKVPLLSVISILGFTLRIRVIHKIMAIIVRYGKGYICQNNQITSKATPPFHMALLGHVGGITLHTIRG